MIEARECHAAGTLKRDYVRIIGWIPETSRFTHELADMHIRVLALYFGNLSSGTSCFGTKKASIFPSNNTSPVLNSNCGPFDNHEVRNETELPLMGMSGLALRIQMNS